MARTTKEIYNAYIAEKQNQTELNSLQPNIDSSQNLLNDLSEPSQVEDWRLWLWVVSFMQSTLESLFDVFKQEIITEMNAKEHGTLPWLIKNALGFQYGDALAWLDDRFKYPVFTPANQIIKKVAANTHGGIIYIKALKDNNAILTPTEKTAFSNYINQIAPLGIGLVVLSELPDVVKVDLKVYYDPLVMASDGSLLSNPSVFPVKTAIKDYLNSIIFNGEFITTQLIDTIQKADGVLNPVSNGTFFKYGSLQYTPMPDHRIAFSGHYNWNEADSTITYIANV